VKRRRRKRDRPLADRTRDGREELERGEPQVASHFSEEEEAESVVEAGVRAAGESDRPVGTTIAPEYPTHEPRPEIDVDRVFGTVPEDPDAPEPTAAPSERPRE
jgi:hypothetical protein